MRYSAANAVRHGRTRGRDFRLRLALRPPLPGRHAATLRIEVSDTRPDRFPRLSAAGSGATSGHGLLLVDALADRWGTEPRYGTGKTVWAEYDLPGPG